MPPQYSPRWTSLALKCGVATGVSPLENIGLQRILIRLEATHNESSAEFPREKRGNWKKVRERHDFLQPHKDFGAFEFETRGSGLKKMFCIYIASGRDRMTWKQPTISQMDFEYYCISHKVYIATIEEKNYHAQYCRGPFRMHRKGTLYVIWWWHRTSQPFKPLFIVHTGSGAVVENTTHGVTLTRSF